MKYLALAFAAVQATAQPHHGVPPPPPLVHEALMKVDGFCQRDIEKFCQLPEEVVADPIAQWMMTPERLSPPMLHPEALEPMDPINISPLLDHMMDSALRLSAMMPMQEPSFVLIIDSSPSDFENLAPEEHILDSMVERLVSFNMDSLVSNEGGGPGESQDVTHHIRLKGQEVFKQEHVPDDRRRLARRLLEVTPEEMMKRWQQAQEDRQPSHHHGHDGHMCPRKHMCLRQALKENQLSPECTAAVKHLDHEIEQMHEAELYMSFFWLYVALFFIFMFTVIIKKGKSGRGMFALRLKIFRAIYSNPELKAKVEDEIGSSIGRVPPLPPVILKMMSADGRNERREKKRRCVVLLSAMLIMLVLDAFGFLPRGWPLGLMAFCCMMMFVRIAKVCCTEPEVSDCKCCCCGGSALNGTAQACCSCCKGTGVCSDKCKACCTNGSCCCDCKDGCDCCGDSNECSLKVKILQPELSDDCKCCCCGGSALTAEACCNCCKGTGVCSDKCKSCCTNGSSCCNCTGECDCCSGSNGCSIKKQVVLGPDVVVYQGIPMQVV